MLTADRHSSPLQQKSTQHGKMIILQLKSLSSASHIATIPLKMELNEPGQEGTGGKRLMGKEGPGWCSPVDCTFSCLGWWLSLEEGNWCLGVYFLCALWERSTQVFLTCSLLFARWVPFHLLGFRAVTHG